MPLGRINSLIASRELSCLISKSFWVLLDCLIHELSFWNLFFNNSGSSCIGPFQSFCISIVKHGFNPELRVSYLAGQTASSFLPAHFLYVFCLLSSLFLRMCVLLPQVQFISPVPENSRAFLPRITGQRALPKPWCLLSGVSSLRTILLSFLQLALSSDKIATLQMPLLNLHLDVKEDGEVKPYSVEMSKEELQSLISSLEAANKVCA